MAEKRSVELKAKQNETDLKMVEAASLNLTQAEELAYLRAALQEQGSEAGFWGRLPYKPWGSLKTLL